MSQPKHIRITVFPESADAQVRPQNTPGAYDVYVQSPATSGAANREAIKLIRNFLSIDTQIRIVSGHKSPQKILEIAQ